MPETKRTASGVLGGLLGLVGLSAAAGVLITATVTPAIALSGAAASSAITMFDNLPSVLDIDKLMLPTTLYAKNPDTGEDVELAQFYDQNRSPVEFDEVTPVMYDAILSSEDPRFYQHGGVDLIGTTRAVLQNAQGGGETQGGSSISQQYVKNVLIQRCERDADDRELKSCSNCWTDATTAVGTEGIQRKLQEMRYAIALEQKYSKNDILLGYLNIANFGGTNYGIDAAAKYYFGVAAKDLTARPGRDARRHRAEPEHLPHRPAGQRGERRRRRLLADEGAPDLRARPHARGRQDHPGAARRRGGRADHAGHHSREHRLRGCGRRRILLPVRARTSSRPTPPSARPTRIASRTLKRGGLNIYTTLDYRVQVPAEQRDDANWAPTSIEGMSTGDRKFGSAAVSIEATTGPDPRRSRRTRFQRGCRPRGRTRTTRRSSTPPTTRYGNSTGFNAGSTFKLFTLIDWLEQGHSRQRDAQRRSRGSSSG